MSDDKVSKNFLQDVLLQDPSANDFDDLTVSLRMLKLARYSIYMLCAFLFVFILWAALADIEEKTVASGEIIPVQELQIIQHLEGGIIEDISVREGDLIDKNAMILKLKSDTLHAELKRLKVGMLSLKIDARRLNTLLKRQEFMKDMPDQYEKNLIGDQIKLYRAQLDNLDNDKKIIVNQISQHTQKLESITFKIMKKKEQLKLAQKEVNMRAGLVKKGYDSKLSLLNAQNKQKMIESEIAHLSGDQTITRKKIEESKKKLIDVDNNFNEKMLKDLTEVNKKQKELEQSILAVEEKIERSTIRSPVKGIVQKLHFKTQGSVVQSAGIVAEVVPVEEEFLVQAELPTKDRGFVKNDQNVVIKVNTYDYTRYGTIKGRVTHISATSVTDEQGNSFYRVLIKPDQNYVGSRQNIILPGMQVQADIITGHKSILEYILKPIHLMVTHSFYDR